MTFQSINPATGQVIAEYTAHSAAEARAVISRADVAQREWAQLNVAERTLVIRRVADELEKRVDDAAAMITAEMGKPLSQARAEVLKCRTVCDYLSTAAIAGLRNENVATEFASSVVHLQPLGLVLSVMPWNFPFWQFFRFAMPAVAAGNGVLLKHAPNTWGSALLAVEICHAAGIPRDLVQCVMVDIPDVEAMIAHPRVRAVTFTGSTRGGSAVAALAGKYVKKSVLELGGSDAYVVLEDADLDRAVTACVQQRCTNTGQSCIAAKRYVVHRSIAEAFQQRVSDAFSGMTVGDPLDPGTDLGPLARADLKATLLDQVTRAIKQGARLIVNGQDATAQDMDIDGPGAFVRPGLLVDVQPGSIADQEELFGPVAAMIVVSSEEEAVSVANGNRYGLGAAVFSRDLNRAHRVAARLEAGSVFVNDFVRSDARIPFGGVKDSGYGRELGLVGLREFVNVKSIVEP